MFIFCGVVWFLFGLFVGALSLRFLAGGGSLGDRVALLRIFNPVSSGSVLLGLIHLVGLCGLTILFLAIGMGLFLHGWHSTGKRGREAAAQKKP